MGKAVLAHAMEFGDQLSLCRTGVRFLHNEENTYEASTSAHARYGAAWTGDGAGDDLRVSDGVGGHVPPGW